MKKHLLPLFILVSALGTYAQDQIKGPASLRLARSSLAGSTPSISRT